MILFLFLSGNNCIFKYVSNKAFCLKFQNGTLCCVIASAKTSMKTEDSTRKCIPNVLLLKPKLLYAHLNLRVVNSIYERIELHGSRLAVQKTIN